MVADLVLSAEFDDRTQAFFDQLQRNFGQAGQTSQQTTTGMGHDSQKVGASMGAIAGAVGAVTAKLIEMGLQAAQALPRLIMESTQLAAQSEAMGKALGVVAGNAGYTADEINALKDEMIALSIDESTAVETLLRLVGAQTDAKKAIELSNVALDAATILNKSEEEALSRLTYAIITKNVMILKDMQLMVTTEAAYANYAKSVGKVASALTPAEQNQAIFDEVLRQGVKIQGARNAAMETAAKRAVTLEAAVKGLKLSFGNIFLPSYSEILKTLIESAADLQKWFKENKKTTDDWARTLLAATKVTVQFINMIMALLDSLGKLSDIPKVLLGLFVGMDEATKRWENFGETVQQTIVVLGYGFAALTEYVKQLSNDLVPFIKAMSLLTMGIATKDLSLMTRGIADLDYAVKDLGPSMDDARNKATKAAIAFTANLLKSMEKVGQKSDPTQKGMEKVAEGADALAEAVEDATERIKKLNKEFMEEFAQVAKQRMRQDIDEAISEARQREDIERRHQESLSDIRKSAQESQNDLAQNQAEAQIDLSERYNEERLDAELDFQRRMQDIQSDFAYQAGELARKNDAVGLAQLIRDTNRRVEEEKIAQDRGREDRETGYERERQALVDQQQQEREQLTIDLEERLRQAEEARLQDIENLNRSLERQREDQARHRGWEDEDAQASRDKRLAELGQYFATIEGLTSEHLSALLAEHGTALGSLDALYEAFAQRQVARAEAMSAPATTRSAKGGQFIPTSDTWTGQNQELQDWFGGGGGSTSSQWMANGGFGVATSPQTIGVGDRGPEAFAAMPLGNGGSTVNHRLSGGAKFDFSGLTRQGEQEIGPQVYKIFTQLFESSLGARR